MNRFMSVIGKHKLLIGVLFASYCGAIIATGLHPALQAPVESGQVLAGIVTYPPDNPFYNYHVKLWTLLNQIAAVLLYAGVSELDASLIFEGLTGAISFAALFLAVYAISGRTVIALFTPLFMYYFNLVGLDMAYPIRLLGTTHTYGIFGLSYAVLVVGLFGVGWHRSGAFLAGLAPAFHASLGVFCVLVTISALVMHRREMRPHLRRVFWFFVAGAAITLASFAWQQYIYSAVAADESLKKTYLEAYIRNFDYHRSFSGWTHSSLLLGVLVSGIALLVQRKRHVPLGPGLVLSAVMASVVVAMVTAFLSEFVPFLGFLKILMPWRFMNFVNLCLIPVVTGLLAGDFLRLPRVRSVLYAAVVVACALWRFLPSPDIFYLYLGILIAVYAVIAALFRDLPELPFLRPLWWQTAPVAVAFVALLVMTVLPATASLISRPRGSIEEIYRFASQRPGMLLTAGDMHLIQLLTRRPVLIDGGGLDTFIVVPETGPRFNQILKVYGLDVFVPPAEDARNKAAIPFSHQWLWEQRTMEEWGEIRQEFGVTDILTPGTWSLQLPLIASDGYINLYSIQ